MDSHTSPGAPVTGRCETRVGGGRHGARSTGEVPPPERRRTTSRRLHFLTSHAQDTNPFPLRCVVALETTRDGTPSHAAPPTTAGRGLGAKLVRPHLRTAAGQQDSRNSERTPSAVTPTHSDDGVPSSRTWGRVFPSTLSRRHCNATGTWVLFPPQGHYMLCFIWARCSNQCACSSRWGRNNYLFVLPAMEPCGAAATGSGRQSGGALLPRRQGESLLLQPPRQAIDRRLDLKP